MNGYTLDTRAGIILIDVLRQHDRDSTIATTVKRTLWGPKPLKQAPRGPRSYAEATFEAGGCRSSAASPSPEVVQCRSNAARRSCSHLNQRIHIHTHVHVHARVHVVRVCICVGPPRLKQHRPESASRRRRRLSASRRRRGSRVVFGGGSRCQIW